MDIKIENYVADDLIALLQGLVSEHPVPLREGKRSRGAQTKRRILDAAIALLATAPLAEFTFRNLADRLDMRVGNLTYHYKTKADLLKDMMRVHLANYAEDILRLLRIAEASPRDALEKVVTYLVQDLRAPEIAFFVQLWALALYDDTAAEQMDRLHELERLVIASLIHATRPDWEQHACDALALNVAATIEGLTIFIGRNRKSEGIYAAPEQEIIRILRHVL